VIPPVAAVVRWAWVASCIATSLAVAQPVAPPRAARSVHLGYEGRDGELFYNEVAVQRSVNGSYFMVCGWSSGYFGMQQLDSPTNKVVLFSVWDPTTGDDASQVPLEQRVEVLHQAEGARVKRFGGEGTGGQCFWAYQWETNEVCRFLVAAEPQGEKTAYSGWFFDNHAKAWRHLVTFRTRDSSRGLRGLYSFVEDFRRDGASVHEERRAQFGNGWLRRSNGQWSALTRARFTASSADWEAKENIDAGWSAGNFYLATGGNIVRSRDLNSWLEIPAFKGSAPDDLPKHPTAPRTPPTKKP
jgi:hypothetical protein